MKLLIIIPARGGSKGIARKNLRILNNYPLIYYSIKLALKISYDKEVYVTSDDDEILNISKLFGAKTHKRISKKLSDDNTTLDPVIYDCFQFVTKNNSSNFQYVITLQPTSPLLKKESLEKAILHTIKNNLESCISVKKENHLSWSITNKKPTPNFKNRLNRQQLKSTFPETGAFLISKRKVISSNNRIGNNIGLYELPNEESVDIDDYSDLNLCEYYLNKKNILIVVKGNKKIGLGHVYNTVLLANFIIEHNIQFLVCSDSKMAFDFIKELNYKVKMQKSQDIIEDINQEKPDIVINDILNTEENYIKSLTKKYIVINFEDLGNGAKHADLVFNAIYPEDIVIMNHYYGSDYFLLRDEFIYAKPSNVNPRVQKVVLTFGGVDPLNLTEKVNSSIYDYCVKNDIQIEAVLGFGYNKINSLKKYPKLKIHKDLKNISVKMQEADIIFSSAGRTMYEIASLGIPSIIIAQHEREMTHYFANKNNGFKNLGIGSKINDKIILNEFIEMVNSFELRRFMNKSLLKNNLSKGKANVVNIIKKFINEKS